MQMSTDVNVGFSLFSPAAINLAKLKLFRHYYVLVSLTQPWLWHGAHELPDWGAPTCVARSALS